mmetsp:Transcript_31534/g.48035  ORF Transcript_31534/g.48035 Transcript_31534/m.48035 type:complete len:109 (-) Transcript_31534:241-567(-)
MGFFLEYSNSYDDKLNKKHTQKLRNNISEKQRRYNTLRLKRVIHSCTTKLMEPPLSREEAIRIMETKSSNCSTVNAAEVMVPELVEDDVDRIIQLDYTARLKQCIQQQ